MDRINIKDLTVFANHGVLDEENRLGQKFLISAAFYMDTRQAGRSDDINKALDYGKAAKFITLFMNENTYQLIETVAEELAEKLLIEYPVINKVWLEVKKPWAPVALPIDTVSVEIERSWHTVYIAMGSNMGDRENYIRKGVSEIENTYGCEVMKISSLCVTKPYGVSNQGDFINGCMEIRTLLTPMELLNRLNMIEKEANRKRDIHWGPRTLDLDILLYDDIILDTEKLTIPHYDMHNRSFVLEPLAEICPYVRHPVLNRTIRELLVDLKRQR